MPSPAEPGDDLRQERAPAVAGQPIRRAIATRSVPAAALLPLRLFVGATFLYAGFDKLLDPRFFDAASSASIQAQMIAFARSSPIGGLVQAGQPLAVEIGLLVALAEIAIGLGALSGLAFRVAASSGAALSILFWLTASWTTRPYYFGPDLPYAAGWLVLAIAGHGDLLVARRFTAARSVASVASVAAGRTGASRSIPGDPAPSSAGRRAVLESGLLAAAALVAASLAVPFRSAGRGPASDGASGGPSTSGSTPTPAASATLAPQPKGIAVARASDVQRTGAFAFVVPFDAPAPLPAGDPGVIVRLANGTFVAYDAVCTHEGCTVEWVRADRFLHCPCHGAVFDPANQAAVLEGPTNQPLAPLTVALDAASGQLYLHA